VPLGYVVENRKLIPEPRKAELVRHIMQRYLELGSVVELADELNTQGYRTKVQVRASGPHRGGCLFQRGTLYHLLANRIYIGELSHKGSWFAAEHQAIVPPALWEAVQAKLKDNASGSARRIGPVQLSLLIGMVLDGERRAMTSSHATKPGKRNRYYITRPDLIDGSPAWRVNAYDLEQLVIERLATHLADQQAIMGQCGAWSADELDRALKTAAIHASKLRDGWFADKIAILKAMVEGIRLHEDHIALTISQSGLAALLELELSKDASPLEIRLPVIKVRRGHQLRLVIPGSVAVQHPVAQRDEKLVSLLYEAYQARQLIIDNPDRSIAAIAAAHGRCPTRLGKLAGLACLAPDIVTAIVIGQQPASLNARRLSSIELPLSWADQRRALGFY
jgi:hypothetical protein